MDIFEKEWLENQGLLTFWQRVRLFFTVARISIETEQNNITTITIFKKIDGKIVIISIDHCEHI